jgi:hypothetical protein
MPGYERTPRLRQAAGIAGIFGGLLLFLLALGSQLEGLSQALSNAATLLAFALLALCEIGLVRELARSYSAAAILLALVLAIAGFVAVVGFWSLLTVGSAIGVAWASIGFVPWFFLAPVVALGCVRGGRLPVAPASALALLTVLAMLATATRDPRLALVAFATYALSWSWIGYALVRNADLIPPPRPAEPLVQDQSG